MSWVWPEYVQPELLLTPPQRKAVLRAAWKLWWANKRNLALYVVLAVLAVLAIGHAADVAGRAAEVFGFGGRLYKASRAAGVVLTCAGVWCLLGAVFARVHFAPCVYRSLRLHGYDVCVRCGYWLRALGEDSRCCPECGATREPLPAASDTAVVVEDVGSQSAEAAKPDETGRTRG